MSWLDLHPDDRDPARRERFTDGEAIARVAAEAGVRFERWAIAESIASGAAQEAILAAFAGDVARLSRERGFVTADVVSLAPDHPEREALRRKFLDEHTHAEDEARFFVGGSGLFTIHHERRVLAFRCERGDLINVPAGTRHWFDMGPAPSFTCIRLYRDPAGWVARYTGDPIASRFPRYDDR